MIYSKTNIENVSDAGRKALKKLGQELSKWEAKNKK